MKTIGVCAKRLSADLAATLELLGEALGVSFAQRTLDDPRRADGWLVLGADRELVSRLRWPAQPTMVVIDDGPPVPEGGSSTIAYADRVELDSVLRGRCITTDDAAEIRALPSWLTDCATLALRDGLPTWAVRANGSIPCHYVASPPPELRNDEPLFIHFSGKRMARLLPFVLFAQEVREPPGWEPPPLQASFMFDDPNLHWPSYGFIDYRDLIDHASADDFHVSMATIPLDAWFVHPATGGLFREHARRVSLLYHGNDHLFRELGGSRTRRELRLLLRRAVDRILRMEARTGLKVARVMAPPHGACSEAAILEMRRQAFDAACVSRGSLRHHNPTASWTRSIGMTPCDVVAGLSVIPRFRLSCDCENDILVAALLRQPIVPMTHHQTLANGYDLLSDTARFINSLGPVIWRDMKAISRSLYAHQRFGETVHIRMWSRRVTIAVPNGVTGIRVQARSAADASGNPLCWRSIGSGEDWRATFTDSQIQVQPGLSIEIMAGARDAVEQDGQRLERQRLIPVARRILTEARDRMMPSFHRVRRPSWNRRFGSSTNARRWRAS